MSKIKQTAVNPSGGLSAIVGARPLSPDQVRDLNLHNRMALESLLNGGTQRDYEVLAAMSNLMQIIDNNHFYGRKADTIKHAQGCGVCAEVREGCLQEVSEGCA